MKVAVTFETLHNPPTTWRGEVKQKTPTAAAGAAIRAAKRAHKGERWTTMVVLLDKEGGPAPSRIVEPSPVEETTK